MKKMSVILGVVVLAAAGCSQDRAPSLEVRPGSTVSLQKKDGVTVSGRLIEVKPEHLVLETSSGRTEVRRADVATLKSESTAAVNDVRSSSDQPVGSMGSAARPPVELVNATREVESADPEKNVRKSVEYREVTLPAGTVLPIALTTTVGSGTSHIEDTVRGTLRNPVLAGGAQAFPAGTAVSGHVTAADRSARVKGRARIAFRFTTIDPPGDAERLAMRTDTVSRLAEATKKQDAAKIGGGAAGGAIIGGILAGGGGAAKGAAIGGAAGTGVVLSTRGKEVTLPAGTPVSVRLTAPLTVRVATTR
jgi:hypothetical protein